MTSVIRFSGLSNSLGVSYLGLSDCVDAYNVKPYDNPRKMTHISRSAHLTAVEVLEPTY